MRSFDPRLAATCVAFPVLATVSGAQVNFARFDHELLISPQSIAFADVDGDGRLDLCAVGSATSRVAVLRAANGFQPEYIGILGNGPSHIAGGDFDGDGADELVVTCQGSDGVWLLKGELGSSPVPYASHGTVPQPSGVVIADFDGDGNLDLAVCAHADPSVAVLSGDGTGGFSPAVLHSLEDPAWPFSAGADCIRAFDAQADGDMDIAVATYEFRVPTLIGDGTGAFTLYSSIEFFAGVEWLAVGDIDGDGLPDLAGRGDDGLSVVGEVARGLPGGGFAEASWSDIKAYGFELADFDGDGHLDEVSLDEDYPRLNYRFGTGELAFESSGPDQTFPLPQKARKMSIADLDGDGDPDVAVAVGGSPPESGKTISVLYTVPPAPPTIDAEPVPALAETTEPYLLRGTGFTTWKSVKLDGAPVPATFVSDEALSIQLPSPVLVPVRVEVTNAFGQVQDLIPVEAPDAPVLFVTNTSFADVLDLWLGSKPADFATLLVSTSPDPSILPGLLELGIGNGFTELWSLGGFVVPDNGVVHLPLFLGNLPLATTLHFQQAALDGSFTLPLATSNVLTATNF